MVATRNMLLNKSDRWLQLYNRYLPQKTRLKPDRGGRLTAEQQDISRCLTEVGQHFIMVCHKIRDTLNYCEECYPSLPLVRHQDRKTTYRNFVSFNDWLDGYLDLVETDVNLLELFHLSAWNLTGVPANTFNWKHKAFQIIFCVYMLLSFSKVLEM